MEPSPEPAKAARTLEELAEARIAYLQRSLKLEDEYSKLKDRLPELRDERMQIRGALAFVELTMEELSAAQQEIDQAFAGEQRQQEMERQEAEIKGAAAGAGGPHPPSE